MTVEYVDAGEAIDQALLNYKTPGADVAPSAPPASTAPAQGTRGEVAEAAALADQPDHDCVAGRLARQHGRFLTRDAVIAKPRL